MSYQVFIDGVADPSKTQQVATAIGERYGLPGDALAQRLASGRFRVKKDVDLATAQQFAADLVLLGAKASVEEYRPEDTQPPLAPPMTAQIPAASAPPRAAPKQESTGLSAAFTGEAQQDLGALSDAASFSLSSIDGADDEPAPPPKASESKSAAPPPMPMSMADDAFLPPDATEEEPVLEVDAPPPPPPSAAPSISAPAAVAPPNPGELAMAEAEEKAVRGNPLRRLVQNLGDNARMRFTVGVTLIVLFSFLPVHLYATMSENTAFAKIRAEVHEMQGLVEDIDEWNALEQFRKGAIERMDAKRINVAITGCLIWAMLIGGLSFAFFRLVPWPDRGPRIAT